MRNVLTSGLLWFSALGCGQIAGLYFAFSAFIMTALGRIDPNLDDASCSRGAGSWRTFFRIVLPLSLPGVIAGCTLTYAAAITAFITQSLIGGGQMLFMPMYLYQQASTLQNWPFASAISIIFLLAVLAVVSVFTTLGRLSRGYGGA